MDDLRLTMIDHDLCPVLNGNPLTSERSCQFYTLRDDHKKGFYLKTCPLPQYTTDANHMVGGLGQKEMKISFGYYSRVNCFILH